MLPPSPTDAVALSDTVVTSGGTSSLIVVVTLLPAGLAVIASKPPPLIAPSDTTIVSPESAITSSLVGSANVTLLAPTGIVTLTTPV